MYIKNNMQVAAELQNTVEFTGRATIGTLSTSQSQKASTDQNRSSVKRQTSSSSKWKSSKKERLDSMGSQESADSDLSDDAFLSQINTKWGEEESELR